MNPMLVAFASLALCAAAGTSLAQDEASLRAADEAQRRAVAGNDVAAMRAMMHANYVVNAPSSRVIPREALLSLMASGGIASERFERTIERVAITGNVGVVMGRETVTPTATSESGQLFGSRPLQRRYTNVFVFEGGAWRYLARHANVMPPAPAGR